MRIGGTPIRLWGWGGLIIEGVLILFFSPVGERSLFRMTVAITMQQTLSEQHYSQANPGSFIFTTAPFSGLHFTAEKTERQMKFPAHGHTTCHMTKVTNSVSRPRF